LPGAVEKKLARFVIHGGACFPFNTFRLPDYCSVWSTVGKYYPFRLPFPIPQTRYERLTLSFSSYQVSQVVSAEWKDLPEAKVNGYKRNAEKEQDKHRLAKASWEAKHLVLDAGSLLGLALV
jgi:hypothetical protein